MLLFRLLRLLRPYRIRLLASVLLGFLAIASNVGLMAVSGYLIASSALHPATVLLLWVPVIGVRFFGLSRAAFRYLERYVSHDLTFRFLQTLRVALYQDIEPRIGGLTQRMSEAELLGGATGDIDLLQNLILRVLTPLLSATLSIILVFAILARYSLLSGVVTISAMLAAGVVLPWLTQHAGNAKSRELVQSKARFYRKLADTLAGITEVQSFNLESRTLSDLTAEERHLTALQVWMTAISGWANGAAVWLSNGAMLGVFVAGTVLVEHGQLPGVYLSVLILTTLSGFESVAGLPQAFAHLGQILTAAQRLLAVADTPPDIPCPSDPVDPPARYAVNLSVRGLCVRYRRDAPLVLHNIDFDLPAGKRLAIVGETGSGKSTLLSALLRLTSYDEGSILLDGIDLREYRAEDARMAFTMVNQDAYVFNATVEDNLRLASAHADLTALQRVTEAAQIRSFIERLPEGFDTLVGEFGSRLSGGERQRVALARALLRQAPILVLDEPTHGLDALTEQRFLQTLLPMLGDQSLICVTHRLIGLENMDEIIVLSEGRIVERGTHAALLARQGLYRRMWRVQREMLTYDRTYANAGAR